MSMQADNPLVSVVIVNYNYGRFLRACIDSVLAQTYRPLEIIAVDDGSTDDSREILQQYRDRCRLIFQENAGQAAGMNAGVAAATGEFIAMLDSDDVWLPHKLERVIPIFRQDPRVGWVRHKFQLVDETLSPQRRVIPVFRGSRPEAPDPVLLIERLITAGTSIVIRRSAAERAFPLFTSDRFRTDGDAFLLAHLYAAGEWGYSLDEVLASYRHHAGRTHIQREDLAKLLAQTIVVTETMQRIVGARRDSTTNCKHRLIIATLEGAKRWSRVRVREFMGGLRCAVPLLSKPPIFARQVAALLFAFAAPQAWIRKLFRSHAR